MFKIGDKVRIVSKTAEGYENTLEGYLEHCYSGRAEFYKKNGYLFIVNYYRGGGLFILSHKQGGAGDYFIERDLRHFDKQIEFSFT